MPEQGCKAERADARLDVERRRSLADLRAERPFDPSSQIMQIEGVDAQRGLGEFEMRDDVRRPPGAS